MAVSFQGGAFPAGGYSDVCAVVRVAYPASTPHVEELMQERGVSFDHATGNRWVIKYSPPQAGALGQQLLTLTHQVQDRALLLEAHHALWPALVYLGAWAAARGHLEQGMALDDPHQHRAHASRYRGHDTGVCCQGYLAWTRGALGSPDQALAGLHVLAEALAAVEHTGARFHEAELHRLKGELLLARSADHRAEAETCFHQALDVARRRQAKALELRAAMSLSRLWQDQGKRDPARQLLAPVYGWFTEGFDTADLQEAQALLDVLS
jgi:hypothetical protein